MQIQGVEIEDTFAEAFPMVGCRLLVTAHDQYWLQTAVRECTGYGTSVIACDAETGLERWVDPSLTPDHRPGAYILLFSFGSKGLQKALVNRVGQCLMTCPTTAVFDGGLTSESVLPLGDQLRYFGDGWQISKVLGDQRYWRIPVMDGEFVCVDKVRTIKGVAGGNFLILAQDQATGLMSARRAVEAIDGVAEVICPFPGGVVRSGSKVGSKYKALKASTNDAFCPTLASQVKTQLPAGVQAVYEIVIDGLSFDAVALAMSRGIRAACGPGIRRISAGQYGGNLGPHHFHLHQILVQDDA